MKKFSLQTWRWTEGWGKTNPKFPCRVLAVHGLNGLEWSEQGQRALQIPLCSRFDLPMSEIQCWTRSVSFQLFFSFFLFCFQLFNIGFILPQIFFFPKESQIQNRTSAPPLIHPQQCLSCCYPQYSGGSGWALTIRCWAAVSIHLSLQGARRIQELAHHRGNGMCLFW